MDCGGIFAPVCRLQSVRIMLAIAAELDYEVQMLDVQTTFLNADVEENIFVKMMPGYETNDKTRAPLVMKLKESLYSLRQSPENRFDTMDVELATIGSRPLKSDPCMYIYDDETGFVILTLYMDDILSLSASNILLNKLKKQLMDRFEMSEMGDVSRTFGMNVNRVREEEVITIGQKTTTRRTSYNTTVWKAATLCTSPE